MMETLAHPGRGIRKYWHIFLPLGIGWAVGFLGLAKGISAAYALSDAATIWLFIGLIAGTFFVFWWEVGKEGYGWVVWIVCGVCGLYVVLICILSDYSS
jgi:putative membrane protein